MSIMYFWYISKGKQMNSLRELVEQAGGVGAVSKACGVSIRAVYKWIERGCLPRTEYTGETSHAEAIAGLSPAVFEASEIRDHFMPSKNTA
ncbi:DNA-binding protein [Cobetia sp. MC34]|uniref:DNA-binding protein n=1 Tax=Cobetia sp. MC34 TaxID=2785080 RepID=UPI001BC8F70F|nr:DNA-binding protein [Cobetia sp. MC34]